MVTVTVRGNNPNCCTYLEVSAADRELALAEQKKKERTEVGRLPLYFVMLIDPI